MDKQYKKFWIKWLILAGIGFGIWGTILLFVLWRIGDILRHL
jgi:hypothetical protein